MKEPCKKRICQTLWLNLSDNVNGINTLPLLNGLPWLYKHQGNTFPKQKTLLLWYCCFENIFYCCNTDVDLVFCLVEDDVKTNKQKRFAAFMLLFLLNSSLFAEENLLHCLAKHGIRAQVHWGLFKMTSYWQIHLNDSSLKGLIPFLKMTFWKSRTAFRKPRILQPGERLLENSCLLH